MKMSKSDLVKKVHYLLISTTDCMTAAMLADNCKSSIYRIYSAIRALKEGEKNRLPIGIHSIRNGYILSEYASKQNDVELMRKLNGARTSIYITANAASPHIRNRWSSIEDKKVFELIMKPFMSNTDSSILQQGAKILLDKTKAGV